MSSAASPALDELLPDLSQEEQLRLQKQFRERERISRRYNKQKQHHPPSPPIFSERERDFFIIPRVHDALRHYNQRHPGGEFDAVKPLMQCRVVFRGQAWFHLNFWARSRSSSSSKIIKRFFAEVHYKPLPMSNYFTSAAAIPEPIPIVQVCTIIEEPLSQYRSSCAFCPASYDILHPKGCRKFVCGNDKDRVEQRLVHCNAPTCLGKPFTGS